MLSKKRNPKFNFCECDPHCICILLSLSIVKKSWDMVTPYMFIAKYVCRLNRNMDQAKTEQLICESVTGHSVPTCGVGIIASSGRSAKNC